MIDQLIASMVGTLAFVILFNVPPKEYLFCAAGGGISWTAYLLLIGQGADPAIASLGATFILTIAARGLSILRRCPVTVFLVTGIFTLVPGAGIYYSAYYLIMNELVQFGNKGLETFKVAGAIALGIIWGFAIPLGWFRLLWKRKG